MKQSLLQKILLAVIYGLIILMVIFSIGAGKNRNQEGYDKCLQEKCDEKGEKFCSKQREINNCCQGAGGELAIADSQLTCVFKK